MHIPLQHRVLNVQLTQNVLTTVHVFVKLVRIPASPLLVESMLNAGPQGIVQFAIARQGMRVILIEFVKNVSISLYT